MDQKIWIFQKNEVIFKEGVYERCMYDILKGSVNIYVNYGQEDEKHLATLSAGQYFGEIGVSEMIPRTATAIAAEDATELAAITMENFYDYFKDDTDTVLKIMRNMSGSLRRLTQDYMEACRAVAEAGDAHKKGAKKSEGLIKRLAKLAGSITRPVLTSADESAAKFESTEKAYQHYVVRSFGKNEVIFREGELSPVMYSINWGKVGIYADYGKASQKLLTELNANEFFGEMGMIDHMPRSATAVSLEKGTEVVIVSEEGFTEYMKEKPGIVMMVMQHLSSRVRKLSQSYTEVCWLVAETMKEEEKSGDGKGWLKENLVGFINEYNEAMTYLNAHPEAYRYIDRPHY